jgi:phosphoglycolate phosphatase-like HAD superfamily hydrolase
MDRLALWDIDRTLLNISGVSQEIYAAAFESVTGRGLEAMPDMAGKTDHDLVAAVLALNGLPVTDEIHQKFYLGLAAATRERRDQMKCQGCVLAGAPEALDALAQMPGVVQSVVTGNIRPIAYEKLSLFEMADRIDFEVGGYGSDNGARSALVRLACERARRKYGVALAADHVVVIGDTPHDVIGARENGVVAIGVASGSSSADELIAAGAHVVLPSLIDTTAVVCAVLSTAASESV